MAAINVLCGAGRRKLQAKKTARHIHIYLFVLTVLFVVAGCGGGAGTPGAAAYVSPDLNRSVTLSWEAPTENMDGTALVNLDGYKIYYGSSSGSYSTSVDVGNLTTYQINVPDGLQYFVVVAYNSSAEESFFGNEVSG
jgi:hypothetical protein